MTPLPPFDLRILAELNQRGGTTQDLGRRLGVLPAATGGVTGRLMALKKRGLVKQFDNEKPTFWVLTTLAQCMLQFAKSNAARKQETVQVLLTFSIEYENEAAKKLAIGAALNKSRGEAGPDWQTQLVKQELVP